LKIDESVGVPQNLSTDELIVPTAGQILPLQRKKLKELEKR
jgi:hypothetical protein